MRTVAVTGATGFIGRHVVRRFVDAGVAVKALSRRDDPGLGASGATIVRGSMEDAEALSALLEGADAVVHAAGAVRARSSAHFAAANAEATRRLATLSAASENPPRILLLSSLAAREPEISPYAASKRAAEAALAEALGPLWWIALRPPAVYGPGDRATLHLFRAMKYGIFPIPGDGAGRFSMIHVADLVAAIFTLLAGNVSGRQVLEISDSTPGGYSWFDLVRAAEQATGRSMRPLHLPAPLLRLTAAASGTISRRVGLSPLITPGKAREILHRDWVCRGNPVAEQTEWRPVVMLESGFRSTFAWYTESGWI